MCHKSEGNEYSRGENTTNVIFKSEAFGDPDFCKSNKGYNKLDSRATHENDKMFNNSISSANVNFDRRSEIQLVENLCTYDERQDSLATRENYYKPESEV